MLFLNGFVTITDSISAKNIEQFKVYEKSYDTVWNAVLEVVRTSDLQMVSESSGSGQIVARERADALTYGGDVAIFVEKQENEARVKVEIDSSSATTTFLSDQSWGAYILGELDTKLR